MCRKNNVLTSLANSSLTENNLIDSITLLMTQKHHAFIYIS